MALLRTVAELFSRGVETLIYRFLTRPQPGAANLLRSVQQRLAPLDTTLPITVANAQRTVWSAIQAGEAVTQDIDPELIRLPKGPGLDYLMAPGGTEGDYLYRTIVPVPGSATGKHVSVDIASTTSLTLDELRQRIADVLPRTLLRSPTVADNDLADTYSPEDINPLIRTAYQRP